MDRLHELAAKAAAFADLLDQNRPLLSDAMCKGFPDCAQLVNNTVNPLPWPPS
jgi:hypothetical protein